MASLEIAFASEEKSLSVRTFSVREGISKMFEVSILARSEVHDLELDSFIGKGAGFFADNGVALPAGHPSPGGRAWNGVCSHAELVRTETTGLSTYYFRIVPNLWRTTLRKNARVFQHKTITEIVTTVMAEWHIEVDVQLQQEHPKFEYRVQYNETDYVFITRMLEEAGISFHFDHTEAHAANPSKQCKCILTDAPHAKAPRHGGPIQHAEEATRTGGKEHVRHVRLLHQTKPGRVTIRDTDHRTRADYQLLAEARDNVCDEERYEHFEYRPGAFLVMNGKGAETPHADDKGHARVDQVRHGATMAQKMLSGHRSDRRRVTFTHNMCDLSPGTVTSFADHPRADLGADKHLLVTESTMEGAHGSEWSFTCEAAFAETEYRPHQITPRPKVYGVQSAIVVGPEGEEIHCDEFGRVRVQFHWDRQGKFSEASSCWVRVSHGWAGSSYGMMAIPRIGQEVLVEFFEGDPDRPVITGRVYNTTTRVPYKLPDDKTKSGWKSATSPGGNGFNELSFDDKKGAELIFIQAQKDMQVIVKDSESRSIGGVRATNIGVDDALTIGKHRTINVGLDQVTNIGGSSSTDIMGSRTTTITNTDTISVGTAFSLRLGAHTGIAMSDGKLVLTSGGASIVLSEDGIMFDANGNMTMASGGKLVISGCEVDIDASPMVKLNCACPTPPAVTTIVCADVARTPDKVVLDGYRVCSAIELEGQGQWVVPGALCESTAATATYVKIDVKIEEYKNDVCFIMVNGDLKCFEMREVDLDVSLDEVEHCCKKYCEKRESDRICAAIAKFKLYAGILVNHTVKDFCNVAIKIFGPKVGVKIVHDVKTVVVIKVVVNENHYTNVNITHCGGGSHGHNPGDVVNHPGHCHVVGDGGHGHGGGHGHDPHQGGDHHGGQSGCGQSGCGGGGHGGNNGGDQTGHGGSTGGGSTGGGNNGVDHIGHQGGGHQGGGHQGGGHQGGGHQGGDQTGHGANGGDQTAHGTLQGGGTTAHQGTYQGGNNPAHGQQTGGHNTNGGTNIGAANNGGVDQHGAHGGHAAQGGHHGGGQGAQGQGGHAGHAAQGQGAQAQGQIHHAPGATGSDQNGHFGGAGTASGASTGAGAATQHGALTQPGNGAAHAGQLSAQAGRGASPAGTGAYGASHAQLVQGQHASSAATMANTVQPAPKQYMVMKTAQTPYHVDQEQLNAHTQRYIAAGNTPEQAQAQALNNQGISMYEGDGFGFFKKLLV